MVSLRGFKKDIIIIWLNHNPCYLNLLIFQIYIESSLQILINYFVLSYPRNVKIFIFFIPAKYIKIFQAHFYAISSKNQISNETEIKWNLNWCTYDLNIDWFFLISFLSEMYKKVLRVNIDLFLFSASYYLEV